MKTKEKKFKLNINLDDPHEAQEFYEKYYSKYTAERIARELGFRGRGSFKAANALLNFSCNKVTAISLREIGKIHDALIYEEICDEIYKEDIVENIECW